MQSFFSEYLMTKAIQLHTIFLGLANNVSRVLDISFLTSGNYIFVQDKKIYITES